jgi:predicted kinase
LVFFCGLPFAGKSTLARILATRTGARLIALDAINSERGLGLDGGPISPDQWDVTYAMAYQRVAETLWAGDSVVYEETNFLRAQRDTVRAIAAHVGSPARLIWLTTSESVARARWLANRQSGARYDVRDEDFEQVVTRFEEPAPDEAPLRYDGITPPEEWLAAVGLIDG